MWDIYKDALISISGEEIDDWQHSNWKFVRPAFLLENNKMYEILFKISISAIFKHLKDIDNLWYRRAIHLEFLSYGDVSITSIRCKFDDKYIYYEGAINKKDGNVLSPFKKVQNGFSEDRCAIDEKHKKFITNSAIYDINGKIICSDFDEVIAIDKDNGRYILGKDNLYRYGDEFAGEKFKEAFLFNAENQIIDLDLDLEAV